MMTLRNLLQPHPPSHFSNDCQRDLDVKAERPYVFIELCAGSASLSAAVRSLGVEVMAFDHESNRHKTKCKVICLDLSLPHAYDRIVELVSTCYILGVHMKPPFTAGPPPLRSARHLLGLPGLRPTDKARVEAANILYERLGLLVEVLERMDIPWTIENPTNSYLWDLPYFAFAMAHGTKHDCHACAFGSTRKKLTTFLSNRDEFAALSKFCQDVAPHEHEEWGYDSTNRCFNTAKEAEYPALMCQRYAQVLENFLDKSLLSNATSRMLPQTQPKGRKNPQVIPEFLEVVTLLLDKEPPVNNKNNLTQPCGDIPAGSRLLRTEANKGKSGKVLCVFGIFRTMEQFVMDARVLWHPFDELRNLPDLMIKSLFINLTSSPHQLAKQRCEFLRKWSHRAKELQADEGKVHNDLTEHVRRVMAGKRILIMEELAAEMNWPDKTLFSEMREGFKLVGTFPATGVFKPAVTLAQMSEDELQKNTKFLRPAILGKLKNFDDEAIQKELYDTTLNEAVEKHWLEGPYDVNEMHCKFGEHWLPVKRFCVIQKGKLRPIDNFKESMLNLTFGCYEKNELKAMEHILWMLVTLTRYMRHLGEVEFVLSDGSFLKGCVHPTWNKTVFGLEATCVDMKSAYKQLPLNPVEYHRTVVSLWDVVRHKPSCFIMRTLPFGAAASVHHFLRISSFIHAVGLHAGLCWGAYFDDFPTICNVANRQSTLSTTLGLFELLGFKYNDEKLEPFDKVAAMLGVELDLREAHQGVIKVQKQTDESC